MHTDLADRRKGTGSGQEGEARLFSFFARKGGVWMTPGTGLEVREMKMVLFGFEKSFPQPEGAPFLISNRSIMHRDSC
jgi:hypothetical protein